MHPPAPLKSALPLFMLLMFESSSIVIVDAVAGEGGEKCMGSNTHATKHHEETKQLKTTFGAFDAIATTTTTSNDYHDCLSLLFLLLDATTGPRSSVVCCEYCDSKASSLSSSSPQPFQRKGKRILRRRTHCCSPSSVVVFLVVFPLFRGTMKETDDDSDDE